jgi:hypothetical protein
MINIPHYVKYPIQNQFYYPIKYPIIIPLNTPLISHYLIFFQNKKRAGDDAPEVPVGSFLSKKSGGRSSGKSMI